MMLDAWCTAGLDSVSMFVFMFMLPQVLGLQHERIVTLRDTQSVEVSSGVYRFAVSLCFGSCWPPPQLASDTDT